MLKELEKKLFPIPLQRAFEQWSGESISIIINVSFVEKRICIATLYDIYNKIVYIKNNKNYIPIYNRTFSAILQHNKKINVILHWIDFDKDDTLSCFYEEKQIAIKVGKKYFFKITNKIIEKNFPIKKSIIFRLFYFLSYFPFGKKFKGSWLFIDRDWKADDNAEYFYRWIAEHYPQKKIFFALDPSSSDWNRLSKDNFNLIPFKKILWFIAIIHADWVISSNMLGLFTCMPFRLQFGKNINSRYCFLQHGVIKDYLPSVNRFHVDCFVTSAYQEYISISQDIKYPYIYSSREVILCGLPRHDYMLKYSLNNEKNIILFMPTWRFYLVNSFIPGTGRRKYNPDFKKSEFYKKWKNILENRDIHSYAKQNGYKIVFVLHPYLEQQRKDFSYANDYLASTNSSISKIIAKSALVITDYSSIAMDAAFLNRFIIYYQFDENKFRNAHTYRKGYFNYKKHGFGPICFSQNSITKLIFIAIKRHCKPFKKYFLRSNSFFYWHDGMNCKRLFDRLNMRG